MDLGGEMQYGEISRFTCFASLEPASAEAGVTCHSSLVTRHFIKSFLPQTLYYPRLPHRIPSQHQDPDQAVSQQNQDDGNQEQG